MAEERIGSIILKVGTGLTAPWLLLAPAHRLGTPPRSLHRPQSEVWPPDPGDGSPSLSSPLHLPQQTRLLCSHVSSSVLEL